MSNNKNKIKTFAGISKNQILKARTKYGSWEKVAQHFNIRKQSIRAIAVTFEIDTAKIIKIKPKKRAAEHRKIAAEPTKKKALTKAVKKTLKKIRKRTSDRITKKDAKILAFRKKMHYQLIFNARFLCSTSKKPTPILTGYSLGRRKYGFPSLNEQETMREEAISSAIHLNLDGNSECTPIEDTVTIAIREYDPVEEGKRLRKAKEEARKKRLAAKKREKARLKGEQKLKKD